MEPSNVGGHGYGMQCIVQSTNILKMQKESKEDP